MTGADASQSVGARAVSPGRRDYALVVDDGTPGGIRRAVEYLTGEWARMEARMEDGAPRVERLELRGEGSLLASGPLYVGALARLGGRLLARRPQVVHLNVTKRGSTYRALPVVALCRLARVPVILHLHSGAYHDFVGGLPGPLLALVRWMFGTVASVVVLGEGWATFARNELHVRPERLEVIPNAVPGPEVLPPGRDPGPVRLLFLGKVGAGKGAGDLLEALADPQLVKQPWQAVFAGNGDVDTYRAQAERLGLGARVTFTGWLDADAVQRELRSADVLVLPSHSEGLPLSVLEGLAHGLAVVATPVGAIPEVIADGETGLLVPPGDPRSLASALCRVVSDDALRVRLQARGRERWERHHDLRAYARRMASLFERVAASA